MRLKKPTKLDCNCEAFPIRKSPQLLSNFRLVNLPNTVKLLHIFDNRCRTTFALPFNALARIPVKRLERLVNHSSDLDGLTEKVLDTSPIVWKFYHLAAERAGRLTIVVGAIQYTKAKPGILTVLLDLKKTLCSRKSLTNRLLNSHDFVGIVRKFYDIAVWKTVRDETLTSSLQSLHIKWLRFPGPWPENRNCNFRLFHNM